MLGGKHEVGLGENVSQFYAGGGGWLMLLYFAIIFHTCIETRKVHSVQDFTLSENCWRSTFKAHDQNMQ